MFVVLPLVHNYSLITLDNWHLAYSLEITKRLTVNV